MAGDMPSSRTPEQLLLLLLPLALPCCDDTPSPDMPYCFSSSFSSPVPGDNPDEDDEHGETPDGGAEIVSVPGEAYSALGGADLAPVLACKLHVLGTPNAFQAYHLPLLSSSCFGGDPSAAESSFSHGTGFDRATGLMLAVKISSEAKPPSTVLSSGVFSKKRSA